MISKRKIKIIANKKYKKILTKEALKEIEKQVENFIYKLVEKATRQASLSGRKTIKAEDIQKEFF